MIPEGFSSPTDSMLSWIPGPGALGGCGAVAVSLSLCLQGSRDSFGLDAMCRAAEQLLSAEGRLDLGREMGRWSLSAPSQRQIHFFSALLLLSTRSVFGELLQILMSTIYPHLIFFKSLQLRSCSVSRENLGCNLFFLGPCWGLHLCTPGPGCSCAAHHKVSLQP